jgi:dTDP-4-dehydrorhamnose reductase
MRLLVTGATGLLGLNLALDASRSHEVMGVARRPLPSAPFPVLSADLLEAATVPRILDDSGADAIVHCAAAADVDWCEHNPELASQLNARVPEEIAITCRRRNIRLIHISTDAVFDGRKDGFYSESDPSNPIGVYAKTKYAAEQAVLKSNPQAIVARVNFYGWSVSGKRSLAEFFVNNLSRGLRVKGFTDVTFCPMLVNTLGRLLLQMLATNLHGLYHVVGSSAMTKFEFGGAIAREFGFNADLISPQSVDGSGLAAQRAHNLGLSSHKLSTDLGIPIPDFSTGLNTFHRQYQQGYPQMLHGFQQDPADGESKPLELEDRRFRDAS